MNNQTIQPITTIEDTYGKGLTEKGQIKYDFRNSDKLPVLQELDATLEDTVQKHIKIYRERFGFKGAPISWGTERKNMQNDLHIDPDWQNTIHSIVEFLYPKLLEFRLSIHSMSGGILVSA